VTFRFLMTDRRFIVDNPDGNEVEAIAPA